MAKKSANIENDRKPRISQADVPSYAITQALRVANSIAENLGLRPARPLLVAQAMGMQPTSGSFRMLCGASIAYGLSLGGYNANTIELTALGKRVVAPTQEGDDAKALREAALKPRVISEFLSKYDGARVPRDDIAVNVLHEMGVPREAANKVLEIVLETAATVGFIRELNGVRYVDLQAVDTVANIAVDAEQQIDDGDIEPDAPPAELLQTPLTPGQLPKVRPVDIQAKKPKVFISHGRNMAIVEQVKTMLNVAEINYEIAVEEQSTAIPVPDKVFDAMRRCSAGIICVTADGKDANDVPIVNQNVLIEIGAAFVLYERRVILLWDKRLPIPSNLQGLYRCQFEGNELTWSEGMKLMAALKQFRGPSLENE